VRVRRKAAGSDRVPDKSSSARLYDYLLGGRDNFLVDQSNGQAIATMVPEVPAGVRAQRAVLGRVVRYLVADAGIRQLLEIGAGLPTEENVHEVAQRIDPATRVVYVDNDPAVVAHARARLAVNRATVAVEGDFRDPARVIGHPEVRAHLDWTKPVGLLLCGVLIHVTDDERPAELTASLIDALPSGSYVFIHHLLDLDHPATRHMKEFLTKTLGRVQFRALDQVRELFGGLELVEPGLVPVPDWRPDKDTLSREAGPRPLGLACAGVARKVLPAAGNAGSPTELANGPPNGHAGPCDRPGLGGAAV
jgi:hypothetical protein